MSAAPVEIAAADYASRLRVVLRKSSGGYPRRAKDRWILLHAVAAGFGAEETLTERAFTERIQDFLLGPGRHLEVDAVTLRRALVDDGFAERDAWGREYRASGAYRRRVTFAEGLPAAAEVAAERSD